VRTTGPPRGAVLQLEPVDLPASDHTSPDDGTRLAMAQRRRDNVARRCWRLVYPDGASARVGLFVGIEAAQEYAREHGWSICPGQLDGTATSG
jgi:hypothetical protein